MFESMLVQAALNCRFSQYMQQAGLQHQSWLQQHQNVRYSRPKCYIDDIAEMESDLKKMLEVRL